MSAKDKTGNLKNMRHPARAHVKPLFPSPTLHSRDPKLRLIAASISQTNWTFLHRWQWLDRATDHIWRLKTNDKLLANMFRKITFFWSIKLWIHHVRNVFMIYCGEGRRHTSVFSRVQSCPMYSLPNFQLHRLLSGPAGNLIYCINLVTLCKLSHYTFYLTIFCSYIQVFAACFEDGGSLYPLTNNMVITQRTI